MVNYTKGNIGLKSEGDNIAYGDFPDWEVEKGYVAEIMLLNRKPVLKMSRRAELEMVESQGWVISVCIWKHGRMPMYTSLREVP